MRLKIDELNSGSYDRYINSYFLPMRISKAQKEERIRAAKDFREYLYDLLLFLGIQSEYIAVNWIAFEEEMRVAFETAALRYADNTPMLQEYIVQKASDFARITRENIDKGEYWTSEERAVYEAVNEANEVLGLQEFQTAIERGKNYKIWHGMMDAKERKSHVKMEGKKIPINDYFIMEHGILLYAGDAYNGEPEEVVNCRCVTEYTNN